MPTIAPVDCSPRGALFCPPVTLTRSDEQGPRMAERAVMYLIIKTDTPNGFTPRLRSDALWVARRRGHPLAPPPSPAGAGSSVDPRGHPRRGGTQKTPTPSDSVWGSLWHHVGSQAERGMTPARVTRTEAISRCRHSKLLTSGRATERSLFHTYASSGVSVPLIG